VASPKPAAPRGPTDDPAEPAQICNPKILLIILNPTMDVAAGRRLDVEMGWERPDDLVGRFIADVLQSSAGLVRYQVAERVELDEFPALADGFRYDAATYRDVIRGSGAPHAPPRIDYLGLLERFNALRRIQNRQLDEVWVMGFPHAGMYESIMAGDKAFWCNAPPLAQTAGCKRRFVTMGFSFERGVGEMLHSYNHRSESILPRFWEPRFLAWAYRLDRSPATVAPDGSSIFEQFILFDQIARKAGVGTVHYAPTGSGTMTSATLGLWRRPATIGSDFQLFRVMCVWCLRRSGEAVRNAPTNDGGCVIFPEPLAAGMASTITGGSTSPTWTISRIDVREDTRGDAVEHRLLIQVALSSPGRQPGRAVDKRLPSVNSLTDCRIFWISCSAQLVIEPHHLCQAIQAPLHVAGVHGLRQHGVQDECVIGSKLNLFRCTLSLPSARLPGPWVQHSFPVEPVQKCGVVSGAAVGELPRQDRTSRRTP
jgi:hypothetical protein